MSDDARRRLGSRAWLALAIGALALAVYLPATGFDFVSYDDWRLVRDNPALKSGLSLEAVTDAFARPYYLNWIPLTSLSYQLDAALFGIDPHGFHAVNVLMHAATSALLFLALARLTRETAASAFTAAVFAVHPLHVEAVAWIASRKDVLSGLCFALCLLAYARYVERRSLRRYLVVVAAACAGLLAKPILVTLPGVLLLLDAWPLGRLSDPRSRRVALLEKLPLLAAAAGIAALTYAVQPVVTAGGHPLEVRIANAIDSLGAYLRTSVWPTGLAAFYPHPGAAIPSGRLLLSACVLTWVTVAALVERRQRPWWPVGWAWFLLTLAPVAGLVEVGLQARADRYMYLPLAGLALMLAFSGAELARRGPRARRAVAVCALACLLALAFAARAQLRHWRDSERLYARAIAVTRGNYLAHYGLAGVLAEQGRLDEAHDQLMAATRANPGWTLAWERMAELELARGRPESALLLYRRLLASRPGDAALHLGAGAAALRAGQDAEAIQHYRESVRLAGGWREPAHQLAWLLATHPDASARDPAQALRLARELLAASRLPDAALLDTLAAAHAAHGELARASELADEASALALRSGDAAAASAISARRDAYRDGRPYVASRPLAARAPLAEPGDAPLR